MSLINLILKDRIGDEKAKELTEIIKGGNEKMLAVLDMLEENDKRIFNRGKREGKREGKIEHAKAMIKENIPIDIIIKVTKLTQKEINKLK